MDYDKNDVGIPAMINYSLLLMPGIYIRPSCPLVMYSLR